MKVHPFARNGTVTRLCSKPELAEKTLNIGSYTLKMTSWKLAFSSLIIHQDNSCVPHMQEWRRLARLSSKQKSAAAAKALVHWQSHSLGSCFVLWRTLALQRGMDCKRAQEHGINR